MRLSRRGNPVIAKGHGTFEEFYAQYKKNFEKYECAIHFRFATQGVVCAEQAHPYEVSPDVWLMHNGGFDVEITHKEKSDTWHFAKMLSEIVAGGWLRTPAMDHLLEYAMIGSYNRLVVMDRDGFLIFNEDSGEYWNQVWYSNMYGWDPPQELINHIYARENAHKQLSLISDRKLLELDTSENSEDQIYIDWWLNMINNGVANVDDAPPEIQAVWEQAINAAKDGDSEILRAIAPSITIDHEKAGALLVAPQVETEQDSISAPETIQEWATLSKFEIRRICYDDPDKVCDAFFNLMQM